MSFTASAGRIDITPQFLLPPVGYSVQSPGTLHEIRGRLFASALLVGDGTGSQVALIGLDLHSASRRVVERTGDKLAGTGLDATRLFVSASHTHSAPGNFFGWSYFDSFGGPRGGANDDWVEWLSTRIATLVRRLHAGPQAEARIGYGTATRPRFTVNRSRSALIRNRFDDGSGTPAEVLTALAEWSGNPERNEPFADPEERAAVLGVDPRLHALWAETTAGVPIGAFASFGAHNTVSRFDHRVMHPDVFGVAARRARDRLRDPATGQRIPIALVSGATGDALFALPPRTPSGPGWWPTVKGWLHADPPRDVRGVRWIHVAKVGTDLGDLLHDACVAARTDARTRVHASQRVSATYRCPAVPGAEVRAATGGERPRKMADDWVIGDKVSKGGTFEPPWRAVPWRVPTELPGQDHPQWPKQPFFLRLFAPLVSMPDEFPVRVVRLGDLALVGLPGEPTTFLASRIERRFTGPAAGAHGAKGVLVCGYAGDYCGYLTTPAEYEQQDYEGSSTVWGRWTGDWVVGQVEMARRGDGTGFIPRDFGNAGQVALTTRIKRADPPQSTRMAWKRRAGPRSGWLLTGSWCPIERDLAPLASPRNRPQDDAGSLVILHVEKPGGGWEALEVFGEPVTDTTRAITVWVDQSPGRFGWEWTLPYDPALPGRRLRFQVGHPDYLPADARSEPTDPLSE